MGGWNCYREEKIMPTFSSLTGEGMISIHDPSDRDRIHIMNQSAFVREFGVQLWSANQRTTEAEEVTDS
jgi:hypothetical protein